MKGQPGVESSRSEESQASKGEGLQGFIDMREITALASGPAADIFDRFRHCSLAWNYFLTQAKRSEWGVLICSWWSHWCPGRIKRKQWELFPFPSSLMPLCPFSLPLSSSILIPFVTWLIVPLFLVPLFLPPHAPHNKCSGVTPRKKQSYSQVEDQGLCSGLRPSLPVRPWHTDWHPDPGTKSPTWETEGPILLHLYGASY